MEEEGKQERILPPESSPEDKKCVDNQHITKSENYAVTEVQDTSDDPSTKPHTSNSQVALNEMGLVVESVATMPLEAKGATIFDSLDTSNGAITSNSDNCSSISLVNVQSSDENNDPSVIKSSEGTLPSLPSGEVGYSQIEVETTKKALASSNPLDQGTPISPEHSSEMGPIIEGTAISLLEVKVMKAPSEMKGTTPDSLDSLEMEIENIQTKSENGISVSVTGAQSNHDINVSSEVDSSEGTPRSLPADELSQGQSEEGTPKKASLPANSSTQVKNANKYRGLVDTAAPFESVKEAVTKFGGIVDWKAHRSQTLERRTYVQQALQKAQEEIPQYKKQSEFAEKEKAQVLEELENTKRLIEVLKLSLEKAQTEEAQAKQDSELAQLRVKEIEQGIASEASVAAKAQLDVARTRHTAAVAELKSVKEELKLIQEEYASLAKERDLATKQAEEAISASKDIEKTVEDLTLELITAKEALESAHAAHMEAEEHRIGAVLARDQDSLTWEKELKQAEQELQLLNEKFLSVKDLQSKLDTASALLLNLKCELAAYMEAKLNQESESISEDDQKHEAAEAKKTHASMQAEVALAKKEHEEVKVNIEKAREEVNILKVAAFSLKNELEAERAALATMRQREGMASIAVSSIEAELNRTRVEIDLVQSKEREIREQMVELPKKLQEAAQEAEKAKSVAQSAQEELKKVKEEAEQAEASASTIESRLHAALKEIEATKASERLALEAIKALQESEQALEMDLDESQTRVTHTLELEEYYALSKKAHDAEEEASERVAAAISKIELAKESEARSLQNLEVANKELAERREALKLATEKAKKANEGKLAIEQELRTWRAENERRRKDAAQVAANPPLVHRRSFERTKEFTAHVMEQEAGANLVNSTESSTKTSTPENNTDNFFSEVKVKKKKSFFPRIVMFLARKKAAGTATQ